MVLVAAKHPKFVPEGGGGLKVAHTLGRPWLQLDTDDNAAETLGPGKNIKLASRRDGENVAPLPFSLAERHAAPPWTGSPHRILVALFLPRRFRSFPSEPRAGEDPGFSLVGRTSSVPPTPAGDGQTRKIRRKTRFRVFSTPNDVGEPTPKEIARRGAPKQRRVPPRPPAAAAAGARRLAHYLPVRGNGPLPDPTKRSGPDHRGLPLPSPPAPPFAKRRAGVRNPAPALGHTSRGKNARPKGGTLPCFARRRGGRARQGFQPTPPS
jgi:hypothetical protein